MTIDDIAVAASALYVLFIFWDWRRYRARIPLDVSAQDLVRAGQTRDAIRVVQRDTGATYEVAETYVEALGRGEHPPEIVGPPAASPAVTRLALAGNEIAATKLYRQETGAALSEAKWAVRRIGPVDRELL